MKDAISYTEPKTRRWMMKRMLIVAAIGIACGAIAKDKLVKLNVELDTGVVAGVWACDEYQVLPFANDGAGVCHMQLAAYISDEARLAGKLPVARRHVTITGTSSMKWFTDCQAVMLPLAVADAKFIGATIE